MFALQTHAMKTSKIHSLKSAGVQHSELGSRGVFRMKLSVTGDVCPSVACMHGATSLAPRSLVKDDGLDELATTFYRPASLNLQDTQLQNVTCSFYCDPYPIWV